MFNKRKWVQVLILCTLLIIPLSGCVDVDTHVKLNGDLSGTYEVTFLLSSFADRFLKQDNTQLDTLKEQMKQQGFAITDIDTDGQIGWKATKNVDNFINESPTELINQLKTAYDLTNRQVASLQAVGDETNTGNSGSGFQTEWGLFFTTVKADLHIDPSKMQKGEAFSDIPEEFKNVIMDKINLRFNLTLPVETTENNATKVSEDGKTLTWKLDPEKDNHMYISKDLPNPITWGILIIVTIILLVVLIRKKRRAARQ